MDSKKSCRLLAGKPNGCMNVVSTPRAELHFREIVALFSPLASPELHLFLA